MVASAPLAAFAGFRRASLTAGYAAELCTDSKSDASISELLHSSASNLKDMLLLASDYCWRSAIRMKGGSAHVPIMVPQAIRLLAAGSNKLFIPIRVKVVPVLGSRSEVSHFSLVPAAVLADLRLGE